MEDPIKSASEGAVIAATAHAEAVEKSRAELMGNYYTKAETDTAHQEIVDNMTTQLITMKKGLDDNLNEKLSGLASKDDADEIKLLLKNINWGVSVFKISGRTLSWVGSIVAGLAVIALALKFGIAWLVHWVTG